MPYRGAWNRCCPTRAPGKRDGPTGALGKRDGPTGALGTGAALPGRPEQVLPYQGAWNRWCPTRAPGTGGMPLHLMSSFCRALCAAGSRISLSGVICKQRRCQVTTCIVVKEVTLPCSASLHRSVVMNTTSHFISLPTSGLASPDIESEMVPCPFRKHAQQRHGGVHDKT